MHKQLPLFDEPEFQPVEAGSREARFGDYAGFVDKFKGKHTTDDCYTPDDVYDCVAGWVRDVVAGRPDAASIPFVRPFYPGGDYEHYDYPDGCMVVDNPPFSMYAKIVRFYLARGIEFVLFSPSLTQIVKGADVTYVVLSANITYANGAEVRTGLTANLPELAAWRLMTVPRLRERIEGCGSQRRSADLGVYWLERHLTSVARLQKFAGCEWAIGRGECRLVGNFDGYKECGKGVYGSGIILDDRWAYEFDDDDSSMAERRRAERRRAERRRAERRRVAIQPSPREWEIIEQLNNQQLNNPQHNEN